MAIEHFFMQELAERKDGGSWMGDAERIVAATCGLAMVKLAAWDNPQFTSAFSLAIPGNSDNNLTHERTSSIIGRTHNGESNGRFIGARKQMIREHDLERVLGIGGVFFKARDPRRWRPGIGTTWACRLKLVRPIAHLRQSSGPAEQDGLVCLCQQHQILWQRTGKLMFNYRVRDLAAMLA